MKKPWRILITFECNEHGDVTSYVGQCLEYDIASQGASIHETIVETLIAVRTVLALAKHGKCETPKPAPDEYFLRYLKGYELTPSVRVEFEACK